MTKDKANYRPATGPRKCKDCSMFRRPASCTLVQGSIMSNYTCDHWAAKAKGKK